MTFNLGAQVTVIRDTLSKLPQTYTELINPLLDQAVLLSDIDIKPYQERIRLGQEAFSQQVLSRPEGTNQEIRSLLEKTDQAIANFPILSGSLISDVTVIEPDTPLSLQSITTNPCQSDSQFDTADVWSYQDLFQRSGKPFYAPFFLDLGESLIISDFVSDSKGYERASVDLLRMQLFVFKEGIRLISAPVTSGRPGIRHTVKVFDNLPVLSQRFYNTPDRWDEIAQANQLEYPYNLYPGQILIIPDV